MKRTPLAIKMRPTHIDEIIGQDHLVGDKQIIHRMVDAKNIIKKRTPLAIKMQQIHINEIIGQDHLVGDKQIIRRMVDANSIASMILYGPPGTGKTSMAYAIAQSLSVPVRKLNAVIDKKKD